VGCKEIHKNRRRNFNRDDGTVVGPAKSTAAKTLPSKKKEAVKEKRGSEISRKKKSPRTVDIRKGEDRQEKACPGSSLERQQWCPARPDLTVKLERTGEQESGKGHPVRKGKSFMEG